MTVSQAGASSVDLADYIDQQPVGSFQIKLLLTCAAVLFLDGFDTTAIGYVAPSLAKEWGLTKNALGPVFSAGLFGLMIGALTFGPLADRVHPGRQHAACDPVSDRTWSGWRDAEYRRHDVRVQPASPPRHHGDDHVLRLLARGCPRWSARGGLDSAIRLALGIRCRWRGAAVAGADPGAAAAGIGALPRADWRCQCAR